jgi:hypothetical protein
MNPAIMLLANHSLAFHLYDFQLEGISAKELATAYSLPFDWVVERIEAVRLCLTFQTKLSLPRSAAGLRRRGISWLNASAAGRPDGAAPQVEFPRL